MYRLLFVIIFLVVGCASKPVLYPNKKYKAAGEAQAKADIDQCTADAKTYLKNSKGKQVAKGAGAGAAIGGAIGLVGGLLTGNVRSATKSAARSAVVGGAAGGTAAGISPDQLKQRYVNHCLAKKGYRVIGWD